MLKQDCDLRYTFENSQLFASVESHSNSTGHGYGHGHVRILTLVVLVLIFERAGSLPTWARDGCGLIKEFQSGVGK